MKLTAFQANAGASPPSAPVSPSVGYPVDENAGTGTAGTRPGAYWFYQIGAELTAVIEAAGLTPALNTLTQLRDAIKILLTGAKPLGIVDMWAGAIASLPDNYALCNGATLLVADYPDLFAAIGDSHGGDGVTNFALPDLRDKFVIGAKQDGSGAAKTNVTGALLQSGGSKDAVVVQHNHGITDGGHAHTGNIQFFNESGGSDNPFGSGNDSSPEGTKAFTTGNATTGITIDNAGVSGTNANLPPFYALAYIIRLS